MQGHLKINIDLFSALCPSQLHKRNNNFKYISDVLHDEKTSSFHLEKCLLTPIDPGSVLQVGGQKERVVGVSGLNPIIIMFSWVGVGGISNWVRLAHRNGVGGGGDKLCTVYWIFPQFLMVQAHENLHGYANKII
jgi:hypothetical protein